MSDESVDPALRELLRAFADSGEPEFHQMPVPTARSAFAAMPLPRREIPLARVEDLQVPGPVDPIPVRVYADGTDGTRPVVVFFHGGGWVLGSIETHDAICRELAAGTGFAIASVDYRRAPEHCYPAAVEDCYAATTWLAEHAAELGTDPERIAVAGESAGANLAAAVALIARDRGFAKLRYQLLVSPVTDADFDRPSYHRYGTGYLLTAADMRWFWQQYVPDPARRRDPYAAPLRATDLSGLPPALIVTAQFEPLRDEAEEYAIRLIRAGTPVTAARQQGLLHGFLALGLITPRAQAAIDQVIATLRHALTLIDIPSEGDSNLTA